MFSSGGRVFVTLFLPFCLVLPSFVILILLVGSCWGNGTWPPCSDVYALLAGFTLGLIPGFVVIAYAYFKATTRYLRATPKEAAEEAERDASEKAATARAAAAKVEAAKAASDRAFQARKQAEFDANIRPWSFGWIVGFFGLIRAQRLEMAKRAESAAYAAMDEAIAAAKTAVEAADASAKTAQLKKDELARAQISRARDDKGDLVWQTPFARAQAAEFQAYAKQAYAEAKSAVEAASAADAAAKSARAQCEVAGGNAEERAGRDANAKNAEKKAGDAWEKAEAAKTVAAKAAKDAADVEENWRSTLLNPNGLQQTTLERAGKIREDELRGFSFLAILVVVVCWVTFAVCWGGHLRFERDDPNAQLALQLGSAGAYMYTVILLGRRNFQRDITQGSVLWCCVTLVLGPLLALVLADIWIHPPERSSTGANSSAADLPAAASSSGTASSTSNALGPLTDKAIFFFAGLAPRHVTDLLLGILARLIVAVTGRPALVSRLLPLQQVRGITPEIEERLQEEGIFDVTNLATADPLRLLRNTSYDKFQILTWIDEAFLMYTFPQHWQALENEGLTGVMDLAWYIVCLPDAEALAAKINFNPESLKKTVQRLAEDAQVQLIWILYDLDNPNE